VSLSGPEERIASLAVEAMLHEAAAAPKPGLVDRFNSGSHDDMDLFTFCSSASVLHPYFAAMTEKGFYYRKPDMTGLLEKIRPIGIEAEKNMFRATKGINTHKGLIFSLGILSAGAGYTVAQKREKALKGEELCTIASQMCQGIVERELGKREEGTTHGEKLYLSTGSKGIRGEAEAGFPSITTSSLPTLRQSRGDWNNRLIDTLLQLMTVVEDSNVLHRGGAEALMRMRRQALEAIDAGGAHRPDGLEILRQMDLNFMERNISPGGCADLLAVTIFLYRLENTIISE